MATSYFDASTNLGETFSAMNLAGDPISSPSRLADMGTCPKCNNAMNTRYQLPCLHSVCGDCFNQQHLSMMQDCPICLNDQLDERLLYRMTNPLTTNGIFDLDHISNNHFHGNNNSFEPNCSSSSNSTPVPALHSVLTPNGASSYRCNDLMGSLAEAIPNEQSYNLQPFGYASVASTNRANERATMAPGLPPLRGLFSPPSSNLIEVARSVRPVSAVVGGEREIRQNRLMTPIGSRGGISPPSSDEGVLPNRERNANHMPREVPRCFHRSNSVEYGYYCTECRMMFCGDCLSGHQAHRFVPLREADDEIRSLLYGLLEEAKSREKDIEKGVSMTTLHREQVKSNANKVRQEINTLAYTLVQSVNDRKCVLFKQVDQIQRVKGDIFEGQLRTLEDARAELQSTQQDIHASLRTRDTKDLIEAHALVSEKLRQMERVAQHLNPHEDSTLLFEVDLNEIKHCVDRYGKFILMGSAANTVVSGLCTKVALVNTPAHFSVRCYDHLGLRRTTGGDRVEAILNYPSGKVEQVHIKDFKNGDYMGTFLSHEPGEHKLYVTLRGYPVSNSLHKVQVKYRRPYRDVKLPPTDTFGKGSSKDTSLSRGWGVHCDRDGNIFVTERDIHCVLVFGPDLNFRYKFGCYGDHDGHLNRPAGITVDVMRRVIVVDKDNHRIQIFTLEGEFITRFGRRGAGPGEFQYPWDVDTNALGQIIVSDSRNHRVQLFESDGKFIKTTDETLGKGNLQRLEIPRGVCFDENGKVLVADFNNHHILVLSPLLELLQVIGRRNDDVAFNRPQGIFVDPNGYLFVAESKSNRIQVLTPTRRYFSRIHCQDRSKNFSPCDITMSPDSYFYAVDIELGCIYKL